ASSATRTKMRIASIWSISAQLFRKEEQSNRTLTVYPSTDAQYTVDHGLGHRRPNRISTEKEQCMNSKIAIVTGASRGLGRNTALKLAARGVSLILTYRSQRAEAQAVVAEVERLGSRAAALHLDVGDSASFAAFVAQVRETLQSVW